MATPNIPGLLGEDLPENERTAYQEGHDADFLSKINTGNTAEASNASTVDRSVEVPGTKDKQDDNSSTSSRDEDDTRDPEKTQPSTATAEQEATERDPNIVDWDGPDDPANPVNWTAKKKWLNIVMISLLTFLTPLASSMFAPAVPQVARELGNHSQALNTFVVSVYLLGFAAGPLLIAPLSEIYGRLKIYHISNVLFIIFTVACALSTNMGMLIAFRFLAGCLGVTPVNNGGGTIADLMIPEKRGSAMAIWAMGPLIGPVVGPIAGGFLAGAEGWRWIFWVLAMAGGVISLLALFTMSETYPPTLLEQKTRKLRKETGNMELYSKLDQRISRMDLFVRAIIRPTKLLFLSPICCAMCVYTAFIYSIMYLLFTTFTFVFEESYGFNESTVGLVYVGTGIGMLIGLAVVGSTSDKVLKYLANKNGDGKIKPEYRLPMVMYAGPLVPVGLFIYGWTAQYKIQWAVPLLGTLLIGIGNISAFMAINTYLVDAFTVYAASAMAANTVLRSVAGAVFPLFALQMYEALGLGWGNSLIAFIALALCPIPWLFFYYGERLRTNPKYQIKL